jgi:hypothetical protein
VLDVEAPPQTAPPSTPRFRRHVFASMPRCPPRVIIQRQGASIPHLELFDARLKQRRECGDNLLLRLHLNSSNITPERELLCPRGARHHNLLRRGVTKDVSEAKAFSSDAAPYATPTVAAAAQRAYGIVDEKHARHRVRVRAVHTVVLCNGAHVVALPVVLGPITMEPTVKTDHDFKCRGGVWTVCFEESAGEIRS